MGRLLDEDGVLDVIRKYYRAHDNDLLEIIAYEMEKLPPAQPEIIRCKDCKHRDPEDKKCDCGHDILWQLPREDNWYCADAKRRTDADMRGEQG